MRIPDSLEKDVSSDFKYGLLDELCLMTFPITLGSGKRLFSK